MNDARLAELREKYKNRSLLEELGWGTYANHSGYTSKQNGEFLNWLCNAAYRAIKDDKPRGKWIERDDGWGGVYYDCSVCGESWTTIDGTPFDNGMKYCPKCGAKMMESEDNNEP